MACSEVPEQASWIRSCAADMLGQRIAESAGVPVISQVEMLIKCSFRMRNGAAAASGLGRNEVLDALSALHLRSAAAFRASAVWTI